ncbi:MAG TPA: serine/threonine-protein kinase, partial [Candidatus Polarisedimenticolia bacterium]|nr:serine/threonine-protein kinase [Candidatus Polarisedimenticolia bacterium]
MTQPRSIGRYEVIEEIGRGAMGVVYLAHDPRIDRRVAIKTIHTAAGLPAAEAEEMRQRFHREAQAAGKLQHPGIVTIYDVGEHEGSWFIAMECIQGETLEAHTRADRLLPVETVVSLVVQGCDALDYAHQQRVVHRDIKPANLMLLRNGTLKITDFGLAKNPSTQLTTDGVLIGTPNYMSPEQILGRALDGRSDLFSLSAVLYELLTGSKPFSGDTVTTIMYRIVHEVPPMPHMVSDRIPAPIGRVLMRGLEKDPTQRFQTGQEMARALQGRAVAAAVASMSAVGGMTMAGVPAVYAPSSAAGGAEARRGRGASPPPLVPGGSLASPAA